MKLKILLLYLIILYLYCANQIPPSGGPEDKLPPVILKTEPVSGSINHPVKAAISFQFSEWIDPVNAKKSITLFPTLKDSFKIIIKGKKLEIIPNTAFSDSTTYQIGFSNIFSDLHGVTIKTPYVFFFSTGKTIDQGEIYGCVTDSATLKTQPKVILFRIKETNNSIPDTSFFDKPDYLVQSDTLGYFHFEHIHKGLYTIIAFNDNNNSNTLNPGTEKAYTHRQRYISLEDKAGPLLLYPVATDTTPNRVKSVKAISRYVLQGEWNETWSEYENSKNNSWTIISIDSKQKAPKIKNIVQFKDSKEFALTFFDPLTAGSYSLIYNIIPRISSRKIIIDTIRFNGTTLMDTSTPSCIEVSPVTVTGLNPKIRLLWSEPVKTVKQDWYLTDSATSDTIKLKTDTSYGIKTVFTLESHLKPGKVYLFSIPLKYFMDIGYNKPKNKTSTNKKDTTINDTLITLKFSTLAKEKLCYSLTGGSSCLKHDPLRYWIFRPLESGDTSISPDSNGQFHFDSIPAAKGKFDYFIDSTINDGKYTKGTLFPWVAPEPYLSFPDTFEARANWDIEGIKIPACSTCVKVK